MPPAVNGDTSPAASPTSSTCCAAKGRTRPPTGIGPPRRAMARAALKSNRPLIFCSERLQVEAVRPPCRKPDLGDAVDAGVHPGDIAARKPGVDEAVQPVRVYAANAAIFGFDAGEKALIAAEAEAARATAEFGPSAPTR